MSLNFSNKIKHKVANLPDLPGVYLMKNEKGMIIYVGKAKNLKNRVSQYFRNDKNHSEKVKKMVENVEDFEYIVTESEYEALVLECNLIKHHSPKYNILLKDDKGYCYIKITKERWQRLIFSGNKSDDGSQYLGPYMSSWSTKEALKNAVKIFKIPVCSRNLDKRSRPCLNYYINQCSAPCAGKVILQAYKENFREAVEFLKKGDRQILKDLANKMSDAANNLEFERAAKIRDKIKAIESSMNKQNVILDDKQSQDYISSAKFLGHICMGIFRFDSGKLCSSQNFMINNAEDSVCLRDNFIKSYYSMHDDIPDKIFLDGNLAECDLITKWLSEKKGKNVKIHFAVMGKNRKILQMCQNNIFEYMMQKTDIKNGTIVLEDLKNVLSLKSLPEYIEAYDISNIQGDENVGGMVVFKNGRPLKSAYKKFKIKYVSGQNDYGSMLEVITRRFEEYHAIFQENKDENLDSGFGKKPDLILIDGGAVHTAMVREYLREIEMGDIPVFGMVKDGKHRTKALTTDNSEIDIKSNEKLFAFVTQVQDEVHRFTIKYHRNRKNKSMLSSELRKIAGIGEKRAQLLLTHFKSIDRIGNASIQELMLIPGMTKPAAESIIGFFKHKNSELRIV